MAEPPKICLESMPYKTLEQAEKASYTIANAEPLDSPPNGTNITVEMQFPETKETYQLNIFNVPVNLDKEYLKKIYEWVNILNSFRATPIKYLYFANGSGAVYSPKKDNNEEEKVLLQVNSIFNLNNLLSSLIHEIGHSLEFHGKSKISDDPMFNALSVFVRYNNRDNIIDDSNYAVENDNFGHADEEPWLGSGVDAYAHGDQFKYYINEKTTPEDTRLYGIAVYLYLKQKVFNGYEFTCESEKKSWETAQLVPIMDKLVDSTVTAMQEKIDTGRLLDIYQLSRDIRDLEVYKPIKETRAKYIDLCLDMVSHPSEQGIDFSTVPFLFEALKESLKKDGMAGYKPSISEKDLVPKLEKMTIDESIPEITRKQAAIWLAEIKKQ